MVKVSSPENFIQEEAGAPSDSPAACPSKHENVMRRNQKKDVIKKRKPSKNSAKKKAVKKALSGCDCKKAKPRKQNKKLNGGKCATPRKAKKAAPKQRKSAKNC